VLLLLLLAAAHDTLQHLPLDLLLVLLHEHQHAGWTLEGAVAARLGCPNQQQLLLRYCCC
jgi:hypothetical protein